MSNRTSVQEQSDFMSGVRMFATMVWLLAGAISAAVGAWLFVVLAIVFLAWMWM